MLVMMIIFGLLQPIILLIMLIVIHDDDDNHLLMMIMDVVVAEDNVYDNIPKMNVKIVLIKMDAIVHTVVIVVKTFFFWSCS